MRMAPGIVLTMLLAGCSAAPAQVVTVTRAPSATTEVTAGPQSDGWNNAKAFSEAALTGNYDDAQRYVAPGSAADRYLAHQTAMDRAMTASGDSEMSSAENVTYDEGAEEVTFSYPNVPTTTTWESFEYDPTGLVVSWLTDASRVKLADRLSSKKPASARTTRANVTLVSAYRNDRALFVVLTVTAKDRTIMPDCSPLLAEVDHSQREATDCFAPASIPKGRSAYVAYTFDGANSGGTLRYLIEDTNWKVLNAVKVMVRLGSEDPVH